MQILQSLKSRDYRLFFIGQMLSMIGSFMTETTTAWLVYSLKNLVALLGLVGFFNIWSVVLYYWLNYFLQPIAKNRKLTTSNLY